MSFYLSEPNLNFLIQREICCLEETLRKRNLELHDVEHLIKVCKKELITLKSSKARVSIFYFLLQFLFFS